MIRLATDVGGTFTDLLGYDEQTGQIFTAKSLTTPTTNRRAFWTPSRNRRAMTESGVCGV